MKTRCPRKTARLSHGHVPKVTQKMLRAAYTQGKESGWHPEHVGEGFDYERMKMDDAYELAISLISADRRYKRYLDDEDAFLVADGILTDPMDDLVDAYMAGAKGEIFPIGKKEEERLMESQLAQAEAEEEKKVARYWERAYLPYDEYG